MPYQNEHACRLHSPDNYDKFRRANGEREHEGRKYDVIYGRKKGEDEWEDQAYRYAMQTWSADQARSHCESHDGSFEAGRAGDSEDGSALTFARVPAGFAERIAQTPWAMLASGFTTIFERAEDREREPAELIARFPTGDQVQAASLGLPRTSGTVAVVPIWGVIDKSRIYYADVFADELGALLGRLVADPEVGAIVLDTDSPGGSVFGIPELADQIRSYRGSKTIYAIASGDAASAAYWVASAAEKVFASPSSRMGSIGVWAAHIDLSGALEKAGIHVTLISAGRYKVEGHPFGPLDDEAVAAFQGEIDSYYDQFVQGVAKSRGRRESAVRSGMGEGRSLTAAKAVAEGLADGIATLPQLLGAILPRRTKGASARAKLALLEAGIDLTDSGKIE